MLFRLLCLSLFLSGPLLASQKAPWLGNLFEFQGSLIQEHTRSNKLSTKNGTVHRSLHNNLTKASLDFMPGIDISIGAELDLSETEDHHYNFDSFKPSIRYLWLDDVAGDFMSLVTGVAASVSTHSRVADLSSQNHGIVEFEGYLSLGKEFGYSDKGFFRTWLTGYVGDAFKGSPWLGAEYHFEQVIADRHFLSAFIIAEKETSPRKLSAHTHFHGWSSIGYEFEDVGVRYAFKQYWLGTFFAQISKRIHSHFCPKDSWTFQIGVQIPFNVF